MKQVRLRQDKINVVKYRDETPGVTQMIDCITFISGILHDFGP